MADGARSFNFPAPQRSRPADLLSGARNEPCDVALYRGHSQLHRVTLVSDHAFNAHLDGNTVHGGGVEENVIGLAGDGQQEAVTLDHASHRSVVATSLHGQCKVVGVRQSTPAARPVEDPFSAHIHAETARPAVSRLSASVPATAHDLGQQCLDLRDRIVSRINRDVQAETAGAVDNVESNQGGLAPCLTNNANHNAPTSDGQIPVFLPVHPIAFAPPPVGVRMQSSLSPESSGSLGPAFARCQGFGDSAGGVDPAGDGLFSGNEVGTRMDLFKEDGLPRGVDQAHGLPPARRASVLTGHRHQLKHALVLVHTVSLPESRRRQYSTQGARP